MAKLTKAEAKAHQQACALLEKDRLTLDEKEFVLRHWQAGGQHVNTLAGAFFTPLDLAYDFRLEVCGSRVVDLCAGIGALPFAKYHATHADSQTRKPQITCIEINPDYVAVGRKLLPEAEWICADVFNLPPDLLARRWDVAIGNPPFGSAARTGTGPRYTGRAFELHVIDLARDLADYGAFIVPQNSAGFEYSGRRDYREHRDRQPYAQFHQQTGIELNPGCGIDCAYHRDAWHGVAPIVEIVCADFEAIPRRASEPLAELRDLWNAQGVPPERQAQVLADLAAKSTPAAVAKITADLFPSELTPVGEQFVMPGCDRVAAPGGQPAAQLDLWDAAGRQAAE